jgi:sugar phosphate isomerase/epimerase
MLYTRRDMAKIAVASLPAARALAAPNSKFNGVQIGAITYSYRSIPDREAVIKMMADIGLSEVELMSTDAETLAGLPPAETGGSGQGRGPGAAAKGANAGRKGGPPARVARPPMTGEQIAAARAQPRAKELLEWRKSVSMDKFKAVAKKYRDAGININVLCFNMTQAIFDDEIDYAFQMAKALGAKAISSTTQVTVSKRVAPFADKHKFMVGFHNHDATWDPNEFATPESFATAMSYSKYHGINLDIGHFTSANYDPVAFMKQHHARITNLHLKDKTKDHGGNVPWGQGDTPIKAVLQLLKKEKYPIPGNIEMEYTVPEGSTLQAEMAKCLKYCKDALSA